AAEVRHVRALAPGPLPRSCLLRVPGRARAGLRVRAAYLQPGCAPRQRVQAEEQGRRLLGELDRSPDADRRDLARADELSRFPDARAAPRAQPPAPRMR